MVDLLVVGPITEDITLRLDALPVPGEAATATEMVRAAGGKGGNPAVAACRLGARVRLLGTVGDDEAGSRVLAQLAADGVDVTGVTTDNRHATGCIVHLVEPGGRRRYVEHRGANAAVTLDSAEVARRCPGAGIALISTALPRDAVAAAVRGARAAGTRILLDAAGEPDTAASVLAEADLVRGDAGEVAALAGSPVRDFATAAAAARRLAGHGPRNVIVEAGGDGELVLSPENELRLPRLPASVVDPTGAGDALIATVAVCLGRGDSLESAARLGAVAAAHTVGHLGGRPAFSSEADLRAAAAGFS